MKVLFIYLIIIYSANLLFIISLKKIYIINKIYLSNIDNEFVNHFKYRLKFTDLNC